VRRGLRADRAEEPVLDADRRDAGDEVERALLLPALVAALRRLPAALDRPAGPAAAGGAEQDQGVVRHRRAGARRACPTGTSAATRRTSASRSPTAPGKYFYVWLDAPIGYLASLANYFAKTGRDLDAFFADPAVEQVHFIGKDITYFHTLFWPAMLHFSGRKVPDNVFVHGFITVSGEKMSKSRGTGISPLKYLDLGMNAEWLRYYIAAKLNAKVEDVDFNPDDFVARVNSDPGRQVHQHREPRGRLPLQSDSAGAWRPATAPTASACSMRCSRSRATCSACTRSASTASAARDHAAADRVNESSTRTSPGSWPAGRPGRRGCTRSARSASRRSGC
jgi:hypothetical protein